MGVVGEFGQAEADGEHGEGAGLEYDWVGFADIVACGGDGRGGFGCGLLGSGEGEVRGIAVCVDSDSVERKCGSGLSGIGEVDDGHELLALARRADGVEGVDAGQEARRLRHVEHGRELGDERAEAAAHGGEQGCDVGLTVGDGEHAAAVGCTTCRIDEDGVGAELAVVEESHGVAVEDAEVRDIEDRGVVLEGVRQLGLAFDGGDGGGARGNVEGVDAETGCHVGDAGGDEAGVPDGEGVGCALFAGESVGEDEAVVGACEGVGELACVFATTLNLGDGQRDVEVGGFAGPLEAQLLRVVVTVFVDEVEEFLRVFSHGFVRVMQVQI